MWRTIGRICAGIGVFMAAFSVGVIDLFPHPFDHLFLSIEGGIVAFGLYAASMATPESSS